MKSTMLTMTCLLGALVVPRVARAANEELTPHHVAKIQSVGSIAISPDGSQVAYTLSVPRDPFEQKNGSAWAELHLVGKDGEIRPYITGEASVASIAWTPDGKSISFLAKREGDDERSLYVIPIRGGEARKVLEHEASISSYAWGPDGTWVAFLSTEKVSKEKKKLKDKGFNQEIYEEEWRAAEIWIATLGEDAKEQKPRRLPLPGSASSLSVSPNGELLAVGLAPSSLVDDSYMARKVRIVDRKSGDIVAKIDNPGKLGDIKWSPDSRHLAMISAIDINDPADGRLMVASASGGSLTEILPKFRGHVAAIAWQDDQTVMYIGDQGCETFFGEVGIDGGNKKVHLQKGEAILTGFSLAKDGQTSAFRVSSPTHPNEIYLMAHGDAGARRLTNHNPWLADIEFAKQEVVEYRARDGLRLEGILVRPLGEEKGKRYPLILTVHGGPESHYRNGWMTAYSMAGQVGAAQGFAVFYPNYRGSTGRGVPFSKLSQGDPAGKEFDDFVDGVDHLIEIGLVDEDRVGVTGGSYGGYASAWGATYYSHRFAASVMFVGISDKISKWGTSDIPFELFAVHDRHYPWDDWDFFRSRSPVHHVEKGRTPLLIMHGKDDPRVHPSQSLELYRYVKVLGNAPVRLVWYPGEGHGNRKAAARLDYNLRLMRWMSHYLKGEGSSKPDSEIDYEDPREKTPGAEPVK